MKDKKLNIQVEGTYENEYSLSIVNKALSLALQKHIDCEVKVYATTYHEKYMNDIDDIDADIKVLTDKTLDNIDITIRNIYPPYATNMKGYHKIIGPYGWEESEFPKEYVNWFNTKLTMVFTMSKYVENVLRNNGVNIPIVTTGIVVEDILALQSKALNCNMPDGFKLLHISSGFPRKGIDILLKSFDAIEKTKKISLILKTFPNEHNNIVQTLSDVFFSIDEIYEDDIVLYKKENKQILLINKHIELSQIKYLYESSNLLVAPSFGEGFGLPMAEAMLLNLPVLTTAFGGQTDFCTDETSWLIDFDFKKAQTHMKLHDSLWAVPKITSLTKLIVDILNLSKSELSLKTIKAREYILNNYSSEKVANNIRNAIYNF